VFLTQNKHFELFHWFGLDEAKYFVFLAPNGLTIFKEIDTLTCMGDLTYTKPMRPTILFFLGPNC
jgi:hypothetical protein